MKKKFCVLLAGIMIAAAFAGCSGNNASSSSAESGSADASASSGSSANADESGSEQASEDSAESSSASSENTSSDTDSDGSEAIEASENSEDIIEDLDENGEEIVIDPEEGDNSLKADNPFVDLTYTAFNIDGKNIGSDTKLPAYYIIKSKSELSDFINKYGSTYSLNKSTAAGNDTNFVTKSADYGDDFFKAQDIMIVLAAYSGDIDLGDIVYNGDNKITVVLWGSEPKADDKKEYVCYLVSYAKGSLNNQTITVSYTDVPDEGEEA